MKGNPRKKVIIAGYYGYRNTGDEAILSGILTELRALNLDLEFTVISGNPEDTIKLHGVHSIGWKDFEGMIQEVKVASLVIIGGGGLIQDYWGVDPSSFLTHRQGGISEYGSPIILAELLGVPSMFYSVGVGPLNTPEGRDHSRLLFDAVDKATVRDKKSRELVKEIGIRVDDIPIVPDPAIFALPSDLPSDFFKLLNEYPQPHIGVSLRYWGMGISPDEWQPNISKALDRILEEMGGSIFFMPLHVSEYYLENDRVICEQIQNRMDHKNQTEVVLLELDPLQRFSTFSHFNFVFGMRLHAIVAALKAGLPSVGIEYDPKIRSFMQQMGVEDYCFPLSHLVPEKITDKAIVAFQDPSPFRHAATKLTDLTRSTSQSAQYAREILETPKATGRISTLLVDFVINQILNVTRSEEEKIHLNDLFRKIWAERVDPNFHFGHARTDLGWIESQLLTDYAHLQNLEIDNVYLQSRAEIAESSRDQLTGKVHELESQISMEKTSRLEAERRLDQVQRDWWNLKDQLSRIEHSKGYQALLFFWKILWRIRDPKQSLIELRSSLSAAGDRLGERTKGSQKRVGDILKRISPLGLRHLFFVVDAHHLDLEDRSSVVLYTNDDTLFPGYQPRKRLEKVAGNPIKVTLVTTVKNEAANAQKWMEELEHQNRLPDEVVLLEGGSSDRTYEIIQEYTQRSALPIKVLSKPGTNIATRRNLGVKLASHPIIAMTDFGCTLKADWLEKLILPFMVDPETEVVAGGYEAQASRRIGDSAKYELIPSIQLMSPQNFLPACRSIAFRKSSWQAVGGFPEWLTKTGEDTYFDLQLKKKCPHWAFVPEAQVVWHAPETLKGIWDKLSSWTVGDGESGAFVQRYWSQIKIVFWRMLFSLLGLGISVGCFWINPILGGSLLVIWLLLHLISLWTEAGTGKGLVEGFWKSYGRVARVDGFLRGIRNRPAVMARKYADIPGVVLFLSGVPIDDTGGGARGTQIALELLRRGHLVIFVHKYPKQESINLKLDFNQPNLLHFSLSNFDWKALRWELRFLLKEKPLTAFIEFPFKEFLPIAKDVKRRGGEIIYDLIDEWNTSLGGDWYSEAVEQTLIDLSDVLVASAPPLVKRLEEASDHEVLWMPNAVNLHLFDRTQSFHIPDDLPSGSPKILYIGALWGEWFDWELLQKMAQAYPHGAVIVIGDYRGQCPFTESNLHFLGLKPQPSLPAYLQYSDVAIIPWKINSITQATSPLKIYEYLAMGIPVVAPKLPPLEGLPYVFLSPDHESFLENIEHALKCEMEEPVLYTFLAKNSWQARIDQLATKAAHIKTFRKVSQD